MPRRGVKKIDKVEVKGHEGLVTVDIYLDTSTSRFSAEYLGDSFQDEDLNALKRAIKEEAQQDRKSVV